MTRCGLALLTAVVLASVVAAPESVQAGLCNNPICGASVTTENTAGVPGVGEAGDGFGTELATGYIDGDDLLDFVVGSPGEDVGSATDAGAIHIWLSETDSWIFAAQNSPGVPGTSESGDVFGSQVALLDVDGDFHDEVIIGVPGEDLGSTVDAGMISVFDVEGNDWTTWTQDTSGIPGSVEAGDRFGEVLEVNSWTGRLYVGVPSEDIGSRVNAGMVLEFDYLTGDWVGWHEDSPGVPGVAEADDRFGAALATEYYHAESDCWMDVIIGVPGEDIGSRVDAGVVHMLYRYDNEWVTYSENSPGVPGVAESGDQFGSSLAVGDLIDPGESMFPIADDLVIGVPGENIGSIADAGTVLLKSSDTGSWSVLSQELPGVAGISETGDRFGESLMVGWGNNVGLLYVGIPYEDIGSKVDAGEFLIWDAAMDEWKPVHQDSPGVPGIAENGDLFGYSMAQTSDTSSLLVSSPGEGFFSGGATQPEAGMLYSLLIGVGG